MSWTEEDLAAHYARLKTPPEGATPAPQSDASEFSIQQECVKLMQEDGWRALRTDPVSDRGKGKGFGEVGMADYLFLRVAENIPIDEEWIRSAMCDVVWVEFKARNGKPTMAQMIWHIKERAGGFRTWIASVDFPASVEGFRAHYANSGLMRRAQWW